jgi:hypothetical protein
MTDGQQIQERMWDYVYGLLSDEESQEMVARIKSDPQIARLYAEVRLKGELVAEAAIVEDSSLRLKANSTDQAAVIARQQSTAGARTSPVWSERALQLISLAACGLIVIVGAGLCWPQPNERVIAQKYVAADVVAPASLPAGLTNALAVHTYHVNPAGEATENVAAEVQLRLVDSAGKEQFQKSLRTDATGQVSVELPGVALEPGSRLEVNPAPANKQAHSVSLATVLPVEPEPEIAYFLEADPPADPSAGPLADVPNSTWNFAAFSAKPIAQNQSQIGGRGGEIVARDATQARAGIAANGFLSQSSRGAGMGRMNQRSASDQPKQEGASQATAQIVEAGKPVQVEIPPELADRSLDVAVQCRGVMVAATSESQATGKETNADEAKVADRRAKLASRQVTVALPPEADGLMEVEIYDQNSNQSEPVQRNLVYRQPLRKLVVELPEFQKQVAPGDEIEVKLRVVDEKGQPAANTRLGVRVWNERLVQQLRDRPLLLTDAVLNGQGFEYGQNAVSNANQVAQQSDLGRLKQQANTYQRRMQAARAAPAKNEVAETAPAAGALAPDSQLNETQQQARVDASVGAKIELASNRDAVKLAIRNAADESAARRERAMRMLGGAAVLGGIAVLFIVAAVAAMKIVARVRVFIVPLVTAIASLLIGAFWVGGPGNHRPDVITLATHTESELSPNSEVSSAPANAQARTDLRQESPTQPAGGPVPSAATAPPPAAATPNSYAFTPGGAVPRGDAAKPSEQESLRLAVPAAAPGSPAGVTGGFGARSSGIAPVPALANADMKKTSEVDKKTADKDTNSTATPPSLFFNANLATDANGNATIRFKMPSVSCEYRLLIDALGNGRIGSRQELLSCGAVSK